jgi:hypothetical protein
MDEVEGEERMGFLEVISLLVRILASEVVGEFTLALAAAGTLELAVSTVICCFENFEVLFSIFKSIFDQLTVRRQ